MDVDGLTQPDRVCPDVCLDRLDRYCRWCKIVPNIVFFLNQQFITWDAVVGHGNYNVIT